MAWNDLTPEEVSFTTRLAVAVKAVDEALEVRSGILHGHVCRWREEEPVGQGREPIYPTHPTCLLCGADNDMQLYCHESTIKVCEFDWQGENRTCEEMLSLWLEDLTPEEQQSMKLDPCLHCGDTWERSY